MTIASKPAEQATIKQATTKQTPYAVLPAEIETLRDFTWRREAERRIETVTEAERFINEVGFANSLTDSRTPGASLYVAVCGRRDCRQPRNVQKDPEMSTAWHLKDEILRRGNVYYARLRGAHVLYTSLVDSALQCDLRNRKAR